VQQLAELLASRAAVDCLLQALGECRDPLAGSVGELVRLGIELLDDLPSLVV
jgi:hypothetical protein